MKIRKTTSVLFFILSILFAQNGHSQNNNLNQEEKKLVELYSNISKNQETADQNSEKFEKEFIKVLEGNPASLEYNFSKLTESNNWFIRTSADGKFRMYTWDTQTGGTMHFFNTIYQYKNNSKVFTKIPARNGKDAGSFCSKIFTVTINKLTYYLPVTNGVYSNRDASQSISVFTIDGDKLDDSIKLFKTKTKTLNRIDVNYDFFSVVDRPERPVELIKYDEKKKSIYIPFVNDKLQVLDNYFIYQLSDNLFRYVGIEKLNEITIKKESKIDTQVALKFINDYCEFCNQQFKKNKSILSTDDWIAKNSLLSISFKKSYKGLVDAAKKEDPELGLDFDPIFDAQDFPENGFELASVDDDQYITVKAKDPNWAGFTIKIKVVYQQNKWLVDGAGVINIPENKRAKR